MRKSNAPMGAAPSTIKLSDEKAFFARGKRLAQRADQGQKISAGLTISFEDATDLLRLLTGSRLDVLRAAKALPGSISDIAQRLQRDRSAVKRDLDALAQAGLVQFESKTLAGHGQMKEVSVTAKRFRLQADLA